MNTSTSRITTQSLSLSLSKNQYRKKGRVVMNYFIFLKILFIFRERGKRKRGKETSMCGCLSHTPYWGPGPQPRYVPWWGIERATLCFSSPHSIHWATPARAEICGELFKAWEMWLSPHSEKPVGSEVGGQDPHPRIGSPMGNQACIVHRLLWDLLLLKLPHPELRQQMFTEYL